MKKLKENKKVIFAFILGVLLTGTTSVLAVTYYASKDVTYDNSKSGMISENVQDAIDELYSFAFSSGPSIDVGGIEISTVTEGDGLYADEYQDGRYVYKGVNPDNYIQFNNELWRIIGIETDGRIKIIKDEFATSKAFDSDESNSWRYSSLQTYLNENYYNSLLSENRSQIILSNWNVGNPTSTSHRDLSQQITEENSEVWSGNVGLISISDYIRASSNKELCGNWTLSDSNYKLCKKTNWLFANDYYWTFAKLSWNMIYTIGKEGDFYSFNTSLAAKVRPVVYLKSNVIVSGNGSLFMPYLLS